jgi:hypothetical protein
MNRIERKKLIIIIASIVTVILAAIVITLSILTGGGEKEPVPVTPTNQPAPEETASPTPTDGTSDTLPIGSPTDEDAPPADLYTNDYSQDVGYIKLPDGYDSSVPEGTVYDEEWMVYRGNTLLCELSTKQTISLQAITPLTDFYNDLLKVDNENASSMRKTISSYLNFYKDHMGERSDGTDRAELKVFCLYGDLEANP